MFSGKHPVTMDKDGRYFLDSDGDIFLHILNFLRHEEFPPVNVSARVIKYAVYFGIQRLVDALEQVFFIVYII